MSNDSTQDDNVGVVFRQLYDAAPVPFQLLDADGVILEVNEAWLGTLGYDRESVVGRWFGNFIHEEDRDDFREGFAAFKKRGHVANVEHRLRAADGHCIVASFKANAVYDDAGRFRHTYCAFHDVTRERDALEALAQRERDYRSLFEDHAAVKLIIDPESGEIADANHAAAEYYGWSREELRGTRIQQINNLPDSAVREEMEKAYSNKAVRFEFQHRRADGSVRDVEVYSNRVMMQGREYLHSIVVDVTDRKSAEERLRILMREVHHRIKNDMAFLQSLLSLQAESSDSPEAEAALMEAADRVSVMSRVYDQLYRRDELRSVNAATYIREIIAALQQSTLPEWIAVDIDIEEVILPSREAVSLGLILTELITNAAKHAFAPDEAEPRLRITVTRPNAQTVAASVADNGQGFDREDLDAAADGRGFTVVRALASQHNGEVTVSNDDGACTGVRLQIDDTASE